MLVKKRTALLFTVDTLYLARANMMIDSLLDPNRGNFQGDIWVLSMGLSADAKNYIESRNIKYLISAQNSVYSWEKWKQIAEARPEYVKLRAERGADAARVAAFELYRNKCMCKMLQYGDWYDKFGYQYDFIAFTDGDLFYQRDFHELLDKAYTEAPDKIHYWYEENLISPGCNVWNKDYYYSTYYNVTGLDFGEHEINIGFMLGAPKQFYRTTRDIRREFFALHPDLIVKYRWHEQDLTRVHKAKNPEQYILLHEGDVVHLCNGGEQVVQERVPLEFYHKKTQQKPYVIHFAGGTANHFPGVKEAYTKVNERLFQVAQFDKSFDKIKQGQLKACFSDPGSKYYTEKDRDSRVKSRKRWMQITQNGKEKVLFIGWFKVRTHKSMLDCVPDFFKTDLYNAAMLDANIDQINYDDIVVENFPRALCQTSALIHNNKLIELFDFPLENVPQWVLRDTIDAFVEWHGCSERVALAAANLNYLYFSEAIDFYSPNLVVCVCITSPIGRLLVNFCKWRGIPFTNIDWGVLPGTVAFDFCGHMGTSWVAQYPERFNSLSISPEDLENADDYIAIGASPEFSRNLPVPIEENVLENIQLLRKNGKKIILYLECNNSHSGNTLSDEQEARKHSPFFRHDRDAYQAVLEVCKKHDNWHILYKPHPTLLASGIRTDIDVHYTTVLNVGSLNEALAISDLSVTILSQSAYVSLLNGVPTVLLGRIQLCGSNAAYVLEDPGDMESLLEKALKQGFSSEQKQCFREHIARTLKYYLYSDNERLNIRRSDVMAKDLLSVMRGEQQKYLSIEREAYCAQMRGQKQQETEVPEVSVIVPVHNPGDYLMQCISSLCVQTLQSIEIICVNNGSTDDSQEILEYYARRDSRIKVHYQDEEPSPSGARNWGLERAQGKYIYFMDSDDCLDSNVLEVLVNAAEEKQADVLYFFHKEQKSDLQKVYPRPRFYSWKKFFPNEMLFALDRKYYGFFIQYPYPWAKLMRRDFLTENRLYFDCNGRVLEDNPHNLRVLLSAQRPFVYQKQLYTFCIHANSSSQKKDKQIVGIIDQIRLMDQIYDEYDAYVEFQKWYVPYKIHLLTWAWTLLPEDQKEFYYSQLPSLFRESDYKWFVQDDIWSYNEFPSLNAITQIQNMLSMKYQKFIAMRPFVPATKDDSDYENDAEWGKFRTLKRVLKKMGLLRFSRRLYHRIFGYPY